MNTEKEPKPMAPEHIDRLLSALGRDDRPSEHSPRKVKIYDFKRPDKFSKEQIRTVSIIHETFARLAGSSLSAALRSQVQVSVATVDQLTYEEFIRSIPAPSTLAVLMMTPLKGAALMEIDPQVSFAFQDRIFGGIGECAIENRPLTDIETALMTGLFDRILPDLREGWRQVLDLKPAVSLIESNPVFCQIVPPTEMVILVSFDLSIGDVKGMLNFCIPYITIEPIISRLSAQYMYSAVRRDGGSAVAQAAGAELPLETEVLLDAGVFSIRDLSRLKPGSLIPLPEWSGGGAALRVGGTLISELRLEGARRGEVWHFHFPETETTEFDTRLEAVGQVEAGAAAESDRFDAFTAMVEKKLEGITKKIQGIEAAGDRWQEALYLEDQDETVLEQESAGSRRPFDFLSLGDADNLRLFIEGEQPQLIALVLCYMNPLMSAQVLGNLPARLQLEVSRRITAIDRVHPAVLQQIERVLRKKLARLNDEIAAQGVGGVQGIVEILNLAPRQVEKGIIEGLETANAALAEEIKQRMFVFEDIILLDDASILLILERVSDESLALSLKSITDRKVREKILNVLSEDRRSVVKALTAELTRVRLTEVEKAQQGIVELIAKMESEGAIVVARPDELIIDEEKR